MEQSLIKWFKNLNFLEFQCPDALEEMKNGVFLLGIFNYLDQNEVFLKKEQIIKEPQSNWSFQIQNLTILLDVLGKYYEENASKKEVQKFKKYDIQPINILNEIDNYGLLDLIQVLIGAVFISDKKNDFIQAILQLNSDEEKQTIADFLQKVDTVKNQSIDENIRRSNSQEEFQQQQQQQQQQVKKEEKKQILLDQEKVLENIDELAKENMELKNELKTLKEIENNNSKKIKEQNDLIEKIESENNKLKNQQFESLQNLGVQDLDEIQSEIASKDTRIREQQKYIDELKKQNEEQQTELKEEIHMQNQKLAEMKHLLEIEKLYEDKYEECEVLKKQIGNSSKGQSEIEKELLEKEKNIQSLHTKINNLKAKLDKEKQESVELQVTLEKKGFQIENLNKNIEKLNQENQQYKGSVQRLNEQIQLLKEEFRKQDPAVQSPDIQSKYLQYRNNLKQELQKEGSKIADFQEYLGNFVGTLESPRRNLNNQGDFNVIIHSQGSQEEDLDKRNPLRLQINSNRQESSNQIQDESHNNNNNNNNKQNQYIDTNNNIDELNSHRTNNKQGSYGRMLTEESDDIKQNNKVLKDKIRELVIEIEALKTTLQAQDSQGIQGSSDERQGLISSNEALSDLIKKKSQLIDSLSIKVVQQEVEMNQLKKETAQVQKLKKNQKMFKNQIELVKHDYNEQIKQKEEEMKLLIAVLYELRDQKAQTA